MPRPKGALGGVYDRLIFQRDLARERTPFDPDAVALYDELIRQYGSHDEDVARMNEEALKSHTTQSEEHHQIIRNFRDKEIKQ